jgi:uncharacterized lipoprotein YmbA
MRYYLLAVAAGLLLAGCATKEPLPSFYLLTRPIGSGGSPVRSGQPSVYVRRVEVPPYLARTNLASRGAGNQINYSPSARWAAPLDQGIAGAVADNLNRLGVSAVGFQPTIQPPPHRYEVALRIARFEGNPDGEVILSAQWQVTSAGNSSPGISRVSNIRRTGWQPRDYATLATLLSDEVVFLSREIARAVR